MARLSGVPLDNLAKAMHLFPHVRKDGVGVGDAIILRTANSTYTLRKLADGRYEVRGGWFEKHQDVSSRVAVAGATWGGSAIVPHLLAACGLRVEFRNKVTTSPVQSITVFKHGMLN